MQPRKPCLSSVYEYHLTDGMPMFLFSRAVVSFPFSPLQSHLHLPPPPPLYCPCHCCCRVHVLWRPSSRRPTTSVLHLNGDGDVGGFGSWWIEWATRPLSSLFATSQATREHELHTHRTQHTYVPDRRFFSPCVLPRPSRLSRAPWHAAARELLTLLTRAVSPLLLGYGPIRLMLIGAGPRLTSTACARR